LAGVIQLNALALSTLVLSQCGFLTSEIWKATNKGWNVNADNIGSMHAFGQHSSNLFLRWMWRVQNCSRLPCKLFCTLLEQSQPTHIHPLVWACRGIQNTCLAILS